MNPSRGRWTYSFPLEDLHVISEKTNHSFESENKSPKSVVSPSYTYSKSQRVTTVSFIDFMNHRSTYNLCVKNDIIKQAIQAFLSLTKADFGGHTHRALRPTRRFLKDCGPPPFTHTRTRIRDLLLLFGKRKYISLWRGHYWIKYCECKVNFLNDLLNVALKILNFNIQGQRRHS